MSTTPQVIRTLSVLAMMHPATFDRFMRELRAAGLLPIGPRGGGKNALHFQAEHLVYVLLSLLVEQPGEAAAVAKILAAMRCGEFDDQGQQISAHGGPTLLEYLAEVLLRAAEYYRAEARGEDVGPWPPLPHNIVMSLIDTRRVTVDWDSRGRELHFAWLDGPYSSRHAISRSTTLHQPLLEEVARLLADTLNHNEKLSEPTPKRKTPETKGVTSTPAPTLDRTNDRSRTRETGPVANPDTKRVCVHPQASLDSRIGLFPVSTGEGPHAKRLRDPPPPR